MWIFVIFMLTLFRPGGYLLSSSSSSPAPIVRSVRPRRQVLLGVTETRRESRRPGTGAGAARRPIMTKAIDLFSDLTTIPAPGAHKATLIFLHGLGDTVGRSRHRFVV